MHTFLRFFVISAQMGWQLGRYLLGRFGIALLCLVEDPARRRERVERLRALCFTDFFRNLGATFIKIGQILSSRPDLLPPYMIDELQLLQDHVPPFEFEGVRRTFQEDFGRPLEEVFEKVNPKSVAAASIAQVHEAWLKDGQHVAVKVRRPDIAETMARDLAVIRALAWVVDHLPYLSVLHLSPQADSFAEAIEAQLDLDREVRNNRRFDEQFRDFDFVRFPKPYQEYCSQRVITMEFFAGKKLDEVLADPPLDRTVLADRLFSFYEEMVFGNQFVHADLHPGNVLIDADGNYLLLDTGLVADIPRQYVKRFLKLALASATLDGAILLRTYLEDREGPPLPPQTVEQAAREAVAISDKLQGKKFKDIEFGRIFLDMFSLLRKYHVWMERELTMMFISDITMEGMAKALDPKFDVIAHMQRAAAKYLPRMSWIKPGDLVARFYQEQQEGQPARAKAGSR